MSECKECGGIPLVPRGDTVHEAWCPTLTEEEWEAARWAYVEAFVRSGPLRGHPPVAAKGGK